MAKLNAKGLRTQAILDAFRNRPGEFYMLKGLLCLGDALGADNYRLHARKIDGIYDLGAIANRMDDITREARPPNA